MSRSRMNFRKNEVVYGPTYGAGLTGKMGKTVKVIGAIVALIIIVGLAIGLGHGSPDATEPTPQHIEQTN